MIDLNLINLLRLLGQIYSQIERLEQENRELKLKLAQAEKKEPEEEKPS